jgi:hypothetical protein
MTEGPFTARSARIALVGILAVGLIEWGASFLAYRSTIDAADLEAAAEHLEGVLEPGSRVQLAADWMGPRARMAVPALREVGQPDLRGVDDLWVLDQSWGSGWSAALERDLEGTPRPDRVERVRFGGVTLHHYQRQGGTQATTRFLELAPEVSTRRIDRPEEPRKCRRGGSTWTCKRSARVTPELAEIDYLPRRCFVAELSDRHTLHMQWSQVELGNVLRGHLGFDDFNARLRSDAPAELTIVVDGESRGRFIFTDDQGWAPFALETPTGTHDVAIELRVAAEGTWQRRGYDSGRAHAVCFELRAFEESDA